MSLMSWMTGLKLNIAQFCKLLRIYTDNTHVNKKTDILEPTPLTMIVICNVVITGPIDYG